jgi:hypothetical protein
VESVSEGDRALLLRSKALVARMPEENGDWGHRRVQGAVSKLGHEAARGTIAGILQQQRIEPATERKKKTSWKEF